MPNIKSAAKRVRVSAKRRKQNMAQKSSFKTIIKRFEQAINDNNENASVYLAHAIKALDKAATKGIIHKNAAARKKSRLTAKLAKAN